MRDRNPQSWWQRLRRTVEDWMGGDEDSSEAADDSLMFHLVVSTPILVLILTLMRKL